MHKATRHQTNCHIINDVKLFPTVYPRIYCHWDILSQIFDVIHSDAKKACAFDIFFNVFLSSAAFFNINFFEKFSQEYNLSVKQFGSRSGPTFCCLLITFVTAWTQVRNDRT